MTFLFAASIRLSLLNAFLLPFV